MMSDNACLDWFNELTEKIEKLTERLDQVEAAYEIYRKRTEQAAEILSEIIEDESN